MIIAVDGFAATGKSTLAKMLSKHYEIPFVDSGALYRGITFFSIENDFIKGGELDQDALRTRLSEVKMKFDPQTGDLYLNDKNVAEKIRRAEVSEYVSTIAAVDFVRAFVLRELRQMGNQNGLIMDGRDVGTVVFPDADFKFFFNASPEVRAERRFEEITAKGQKITFDEVLQNLLIRDKTDSERDLAPLKKAEDAIEVDTSNLTINQVFGFLIRTIALK
ncbi:MAG: (d)CMP kinase [Bacteroidetes bacterium]|nr:(d)CMP kinase [Bacteroidota bacterium]